MVQFRNQRTNGFSGDLEPGFKQYRSDLTLRAGDLRKMKVSFSPPVLVKREDTNRPPGSGSDSLVEPPVNPLVVCRGNSSY